MCDAAKKGGETEHVVAPIRHKFTELAGSMTTEEAEGILAGLKE